MFSVYANFIIPSIFEYINSIAYFILIILLLLTDLPKLLLGYTGSIMFIDS